jgi:hypothetical protein
VCSYLRLDLSEILALWGSAEKRAPLESRPAFRPMEMQSSTRDPASSVSSFNLVTCASCGDIRNKCWTTWRLKTKLYPCTTWSRPGHTVY